MRGDLLPNPADNFNGRRNVVIICHGHTWNKLNSVKYAQIFYNLGYSVVIYDHAYFGSSDGNYTTLGYYERNDLSAVIDFVRTQFGQDCFLALHGESMGAATVLGLLGLRSDVDAVVADCAYSKTMAFYRELCRVNVHLPSFPVVDFANVESRYTMNYDFRSFNPIDSVANSAVPVCFIHGMDDKFIYPHHSQDMYRASTSPLSQLHLFAGAAHARSYQADKELYAQIVANFLSSVQSAANTSAQE